MKQKKLALSLRGGGAKTLGYLGIVDALVENNIRIDGLITSSAGSIMGGSIAFGIDSEKVVSHFRNWNRTKYFNFDAIKEFSLASDNASIDYAKQLIGERDLAEADIPIYVQITNLTEERKEIINKGPAAEYCIASAALPLAYHPIEINGVKYIDSDVMPSNGVEYMKEKGYEIVIEVGGEQHISDSIPMKYLQLLMKHAGELENRIAKSDLRISYNSDDVGMLDFKKASEVLYDRGYQAGIDSIEEVKRRILVENG